MSAVTARGTRPRGRIRDSNTRTRSRSTSTAPTSIGSASPSSGRPVVSKSTTASGPTAASQRRERREIEPDLAGATSIARGSIAHRYT